ncbi:uncharacterized protein [Cherax quadricarinatus]|uniref:uncharacterized protein isoform X2 n=1 Tax=Cherax quadricarinatus TaxID=27406 RepID=UPI00387E2F9E
MSSAAEGGCHQPLRVECCLVIALYCFSEEMADGGQEIEEVLVPELVLPHGLTADTLATLMTSILLRQVYCQACPWAQWLLLAALEILHGHPVPKLDAQTLIMLQRTDNREGPKKNSNSTNGLKENSPETSSIKEHASEGKMLVGEYIDHKEMKKNSKYRKRQKDNLDISSDQMSDRQLCVGSDIDVQRTPMNIGKDMGVQTVSSMTKDSSVQTIPSMGKDFGIQTTPKIMGRAVNKWVQVKKFRQISQSIQTEESFCSIKQSIKSTHDEESQTENLETVKNICDKETQTLIEKSESRSRERKMSFDSKWRLSHISDLPKRRYCSGVLSETKRKNVQREHSGKEKGYAYFFHSSRSPEHLRDKNHELTVNGDSDLSLPYSVQESHLISDAKKSELDIPLFHGRPLIGCKSEKNAADIPLDPVNGIESLLLEDPRYTEN